MKPFKLEEWLNAKAVCTKDGHDVVILKYNARGQNRLIGYIKFENSDVARSWTLNGSDSQGNPEYDLCMKPTKKMGWIIIVPGCSPLPFLAIRSGVFDTREEAEKVMQRSDIGTVVARVEYEE